MDEDNFLLSLSLLTENTKMIQSDVAKVKNDVSILKSSSSSSSEVATTGIDETQLSNYLTTQNYINQTQLSNYLTTQNYINLGSSGTTSDNNKLLKYNHPPSGTGSYEFSGITTGSPTGAGGEDVSGVPQDTALRVQGGISIGPPTVLSAIPEKICLNGVIGLGGTSTTVNYGTPDQVLSSRGPNVLPTWKTINELPDISNNLPSQYAILDVKLTGGNVTVPYGSSSQSNDTELTNWEQVTSTDSIDSVGGYVFVPIRDGKYDVEVNLNIVNSTLVGFTGYDIKIYTERLGIQTYDFRTVMYDDQTIFTNQTSFSLYAMGPPSGLVGANLVIDAGASPPSAENVATDGMSGSSTSYISLEDNSYFAGIKDLTEFSIEMDIKVGALDSALFNMSSSGGTREVSLQMGGTDTLITTWQGPNQRTGSIQMTVNRTSFEHLIFVFTASGVTVYKNGSLYSPTVAVQMGFEFDTITEILFGYNPFIVDNGVETVRSFRFHSYAVTSTEAINFYAARNNITNRNIMLINSGTIISDESASANIIHKASLDLVTRDNLRVFVGSSSGLSFDVADGSVAGEGESHIIFRKGDAMAGQTLIIDNQTPPSAVWSTPAGIPLDSDFNTVDAVSLNNQTTPTNLGSGFLLQADNIFIHGEQVKINKIVTSGPLSQAGNIDTDKSYYVHVHDVKDLQGNSKRLIRLDTSPVSTNPYGSSLVAITVAANTTHTNNLLTIPQGVYDTLRDIEKVRYSLASGSHIINNSTTGPSQILYVRKNGNNQISFYDRYLDGVNGISYLRQTLLNTDSVTTSSIHLQFTSVRTPEFPNNVSDTVVTFNLLTPREYVLDPFNGYALQDKKTKEYFFAKTSVPSSGTGTFTQGDAFRDLSTWTSGAQSNVLMFKNALDLFTAPRTGMYKIDLQATTSHNTANVFAVSTIQMGTPLLKSPSGVSQLYENVLSTQPLRSYDFRQVTLGPISTPASGPSSRSLTFQEGYENVSSSDIATLFGTDVNDFPSVVNGTTGIQGTTTSWIQLSSTDFPNPTTGFTIEFFGTWQWVNDGDPSTYNHDTLFSMYSPVGNTAVPSPNNLWTFPNNDPDPAVNAFTFGRMGQSGYDQPNQIGIAYKDTGGNWRYVLYADMQGSQEIPMNVQSHYVIVAVPQTTADPNVSSIELFINGVKLTPYYRDTQAFNGGTRQFITLGRSSNTDNGIENVAAFRYFNSPLADADVKKLYDAMIDPFIETTKETIRVEPPTNQYPNQIRMLHYANLSKGDKIGFRQKVEYDSGTGTTHGVEASVSIETVD